MPHIEIISASIRTGRQSHRVALFFKRFLEEKKLATANILDLKSYNFPLFEERLSKQTSPLPAAKEFSEKIRASHAVIIVTPEYNGGYPASLKNVVDLLYIEWRRKPIAVAAASDGQFGGTQVITSLLFSLLKIGALTVPARFHAANVQDAYDENGIPRDVALTEKMATLFVNEILRYVE